MIIWYSIGVICGFILDIIKIKRLTIGSLIANFAIYGILGPVCFIFFLDDILSVLDIVIWKGK